MVNYDKFDKIVEEDEKQELDSLVNVTEKLVMGFKEQGNQAYKEGKLTEAVGHYTSCIVLLTGQRDPRVTKEKVMKEIPKEPKKETEEEAKARLKEEKKQEKARAKMEEAQKDMPKGVQAIDPMAMQQQQQQQEEEPSMDPLGEMGNAHEGWVEDAEIEMRTGRAMLLLQSSQELRTLLSSSFSNRAMCAVKISEGKEEAFKKKITSSPGGIDKWDMYRVRMTSDSLQDSKQAIQLDPTNQKAWYRIGYGTSRLIALIDRIRERKAWLREEELPILDKPALWEEARGSIATALTLLKKENGSPTEIKAVHDKLVEVYQAMGKMTCSVRKLGHENLAMTVNEDTLVLEGVDEKGPAEKWGAAHFIGCPITHMKVGDDGAMLKIKDLNDLAVRQTHASYVTLAFAPAKALPPLPALKDYLPAGSELLASEMVVQNDDDAVAAPKAKAPVKAKALPDPSESLPRGDDGQIIYKPKNAESAERWGPPPVPKRLRKKKTLITMQMVVGGSSVFVVLLAMLVAMLLS